MAAPLLRPATAGGRARRRRLSRCCRAIVTAVPIAAVVLFLHLRAPLPQGLSGHSCFVSPLRLPGVQCRSRSRGSILAAAAGEKEAPLTDDEGTKYARFEGGEPVEAKEKSEATDGKEAEAPVPDEFFVGQVKSYAPQQGYGFIECEETHKRFAHDVFLHKNQVDDLKGIAKGDNVRFSVTLNSKGRPQARNVERYITGSWVPRTKTFVGKVKTFSPVLGYGFIACEDTRMIFNQDVFLHRQQFEQSGVEKGSFVTFTVEVSKKGNPQARDVERFTVSTPALEGEEGLAGGPAGGGEKKGEAEDEKPEAKPDAEPGPESAQDGKSEGEKPDAKSEPASTAA